MTHHVTAAIRTAGPAPAPDVGAPDPGEVYALGMDPAETARLVRQSAELRPEALALLADLGLEPGRSGRAGRPGLGSAIDLGCGPLGILDLLSAVAAPGARVVGLDADPAHVAAARQYAERQGLAGVEVVAGDARHTGFPDGSFDLVHARTLLVTVPAPAEVVAEMARLARPGGWVACQEPDVETTLCHPPLPALDALIGLFRASFERAGADLRVGRRVGGMFWDAGLEDVRVTVHASCYPAGHTRRTVVPDLARSLWPVIIGMGLASAAELDALDAAVRAHLADPRVLMMPNLLVTTRGRKPE
jgi:SAM-dependent methyltransferase